MSKSLAYAVKKVVALLVGTSGANNGAAIDRLGYDEINLVVSTGAATGTPDSYSVAAKLQESEDGSTGWTDITGGAITAITADATTKQVSIKGKPALKRYVRVVTTPAYVGGTSPKVPVAVTVLLGRGETGPVA